MAGPRPRRPNNTHSRTHTLAPITRRQADLDLSDLSEKERDLLYDDHLGHVQLASFRLQDQIGIEDDVPRSFTNLTHFLEHPTERFEEDVDADAVHDLSGDWRDEEFSEKNSDKMESLHPSTSTELKNWYVVERENVVESVGFNSYHTHNISATEFESNASSAYGVEDVDEDSSDGCPIDLSEWDMKNAPCNKKDTRLSAPTSHTALHSSSREASTSESRPGLPSQGIDNENKKHPPQNNDPRKAKATNPQLKTDRLISSVMQNHKPLQNPQTRDPSSMKVHSNLPQLATIIEDPKPHKRKRLLS